MEIATVTPGTDATDELRQFPDLTDKEEAFVHALLATGGKLKASAIKAGYSPRSAQVTASRLARKPAVLRAIQTASVQALGALAPQAIGKLAQLGMKAKSEYVQLEASKDILDRIGMVAPKQITVGGHLNVNIDLS